VVFFAAVFLAGAFFAVVFFAVAFLAGAAFFAGAFFATVFLAGAAFLAAAFFAGRLPVSTASLNALSGVTRTRRDALMRIASPVCGLRPMRAARSTRANLAKPLIATGSPFATVSVTVSTNAWSAASALRLSVSRRSASSATSSLRFMLAPEIKGVAKRRA
jgi:hypothetical protein